MGSNNKDSERDFGGHLAAFGYIDAKIYNDFDLSAMQQHSAGFA